MVDELVGSVKSESMIRQFQGKICRGVNFSKNKVSRV